MRFYECSGKKRAVRSRMKSLVKSSRNHKKPNCWLSTNQPQALVAVSVAKHLRAIIDHAWHDWFPPSKKQSTTCFDTPNSSGMVPLFFVCQLSNSPLWNLLPASGVETWRSLWTLFSCHRPIKRDPRDPPSKSSKTSYSIYATLERCKSWKMVQKIKMQPEVMQSSGILGNWGKTASWLLVAAIESSNSSEGKESVSRRPCFMKPKRSLLPVILGAGIATWHDQQTFFVMTMTTILMTVRFEHAYYDDFDDEVW